MSFLPPTDNEHSQVGSWADEAEKADQQAPSNLPSSSSSTATPSSSTTKPASGDVDSDLAASTTNLSLSIKKSLLIDIDGSDLEVQAADPNSPLYSVKTFEELAHLPNTTPIPDSVLKGITEVGFRKPSKIQESALPLLLKNPIKSSANPLGKPENLIFQSQAGTGKTAAFTINVLSRCNVEDQYPQALYTSPTFNLCHQTASVIEKLGKHTGLKVALVHAQDRDQDEDGPPPPIGKLNEQIVSGTLGKLKHFVSMNPRKQPFNPKKIKVFVIDEADKLMKQSYSRDDIKFIIGKLPETVQLIFLSATFEPDLLEFAKKHVSEPRNIITLPRQEVSVDNIKQLFIRCQGDSGKYAALTALYESVEVGQAIIFANKREKAMSLAAQMQEDGHEVSVLVGGKDMPKATQKAILDRFRRGDSQVLVCSDVLARGIDVEHISVVINFDIPTMRKVTAGNNHVVVPDPDTYLHRIGRTGRFGKKGTAITLVDMEEPWQQDQIKKIQDHWGREIEEIRNAEELTQKVTTES